MLPLSLPLPLQVTYEGMERYIRGYPIGFVDSVKVRAVGKGLEMRSVSRTEESEAQGLCQWLLLRLNTHPSAHDLPLDNMRQGVHIFNHIIIVGKIHPSFDGK